MVRAFLFGAGATKAQYKNSPLNNDFFKILWTVDKRLCKQINKDIKLEYGLDESNLEDIINYSESLPQSNQKALFYNIYLAIHKLLVKETKSNESDIINAINVGGELTTFKNLLIDSRISPKDFFMTLNYDLYLDREILSNFGTISYGNFKGELKSTMPGNNIRLSGKPYFSLYHLHGSLNWEILPGRRNITYHLGAISPRWSTTGSFILIVPPGKKEIPQQLKRIWQEANRRLKKASELIIVGCSLNLLDIDLIKLIKSFVIKKGSENVKIIHLRSENSKISENNYRNIFGKEFKLYPYGFTNNPEGSNIGALEFIFQK